MNHILMIGLIMIIVGFVTTFLKITIDRIFLVLLLVLWMGFGISDAILINGLVMALASLVFFRGARGQLAQIPASVKWSIIPLAFVGGVIGRYVGIHLSSRTLFIVLGAYALLVGLRLLLLRPKMVPDGKFSAGVSVISFIFSFLTGLISAGGKPIQIPILVKGFKLSMSQAYLVASLGTMASVAGMLVSEVWFHHAIAFTSLAWSWIYFIGISIVMFVVEPFWSMKGQKWVTMLVGVLLAIVGIKLIV